MTLRHMCNSKRLMFTILIFFCCLVTAITCSASSGFGYDENAGGTDCPLDKTPLSSCQYYSQYLKADKDLNLEYKKISKMLDKQTFVLLKQAELLWVEWRDEKASGVYEKRIICAGTVCIDQVHDNCIIDLTEKRTVELRQFQKDIKSAKDKSFKFEKEIECERKWGPRD